MLTWMILLPKYYMWHVSTSADLGTLIHIAMEWLIRVIFAVSHFVTNQFEVNAVPTLALELTRATLLFRICRKNKKCKMNATHEILLCSVIY